MSKEIYKVVFVAADDMNFIVTYHVKAKDWKQAGEKAEKFISIDYPTPKEGNVDFVIEKIELTDIVIIS